jgi:hypothetical protein
MAFEVNGIFTKGYWGAFIQPSIETVFGTNWNGLKILDIGKQDSTYREEHMADLGVDYTVFEPVGENKAPLLGKVWKGSIFRQFHRPETFEKYHNTFDVVINIGTIEHLPKQATVWAIIHNITKPGGLMIHAMPDAQECLMYLRWFGHSNNYYSEEFYQHLADNANYQIVDNQLINWNRCVALKKLQDNSFIVNTRELTDKITRL